MGKISRRTFIGGAFGLGALAISYNYGRTWWFDSFIQGRSFDARILTTGINGHLFEGPLKGKKSTLLTEVDLLQGWVKQTQLPMTGPHAPCYLPGARILSLSAHTRVSLVLDQNHNIIHRFETPKGYVFGGHSFVAEDYGYLVISIKKQISDSFTNAGFVDFYDLKDFKLLKRLVAPSTFAHDIARITGDTLVISQYGTLYFDFMKTDRPITKNNVVFLMEVSKPMLSYLDLKTLEFVHHRELVQTHGLNHITEGRDEEIYAVSVQAVGRDEQSLAYVTEHYKDPAIVAQKDVDPAAQGNFVPLPSPLTMIPKVGAVKEYMGRPSLQVRSQDLVGVASDGWVVASFPNSQTIGFLKDQQDIQLIDTSQWKIQAPRALGIMPDQRHFAVGDQENGILIMDSKTLQPASSIRFAAHRCVHLDTRFSTSRS